VDVKYRPMGAWVVRLCRMQCAIDVVYCYRQRGVVCLCVCVGDDREPCKNAEPIEMPYGADWCGPGEYGG